MRATTVHPATGSVVGRSMLKQSCNSSETVRDQPSCFTVWRLVVSPSAGKDAPRMPAIAPSTIADLSRI
jgi:hypothetical protein